MKYAETGQGSYSDDDSLEAIEAPLEEEGRSEGFGLPGQSAVGTVSFFRLADIGNEDENSTRLTALGDEPKDTIDVVGKPDVVSNQGLSSVSPGSLSPLINGVPEGKKMSLSSKIAFVMENGEPFCNHCERNFVPEALGPRMACTFCGCGRPNDDHNIGQDDFNGKDLLSHAEGETVKDEDAGRNIIKEDSTVSSKRDSADEFLEYFHSSSDASKLYYQGYMDAESGKLLDEDMALLSKDYYNGYEQYKFYNKSPQQSEGQKLFNIKPNSNQIPRQGEMTPGEADRGPLELTDGTNHATASKVLGLYEEFKTAGWGQIIKDVASDAATVALHATPNDLQASNYTKRTYMDYDERKAQKEWHDKSAELHSEAANNPNLNKDQRAAHQSAADVHSNLSSQFPKSNIGVFPVHTRDFYDRATAQGIAASQAAGIKNIPSFGATDPRIQKAYNKLKPGINATKISSIFPVDVIQNFFEV